MIYSNRFAAFHEKQVAAQVSRLKAAVYKTSRNARIEPFMGLKFYVVTHGLSLKAFGLQSIYLSNY